MTTSQSMDEKFALRLREIIVDQTNTIDMLTYEISEANKQLIKMINKMSELTEEIKEKTDILNDEQYFLEKFNLHLELELTRKISNYEYIYGKK